jgi:rapamycin-insensitive companion of mTOR
MPRLNRHDPLDRGQMLIQQAKLRQGLALDDRQFIQMINDSGIILNRDHTKWNYEMIVDLLEGPLMNPKRLDEALKATKFVRRLLAFFHPLNGRFSLIRRSRVCHLRSPGRLD